MIKALSVNSSEGSKKLVMLGSVVFIVFIYHHEPVNYLKEPSVKKLTGFNSQLF